LGSEVAILVKKIDFEDLFTVGGVCISENESYEEGEDISECSISDIGGEGVVVVGVEELCGWRGTRREVIPPA